MVCPYLGKSLRMDEVDAASSTSDYVLVFGTIAIDARNENSGTARSFNDALCPFLRNLNVKMVDGVVWVYVREDIDILKGQEMFLAYGWVYW